MWKGERFNHGNLPLTAFPAPLADLPIGSGNGCCVVVKQPIPKRFCVDNSWDAVSQVWWKNVRHEPVSSCQWCDLTNNGDIEYCYMNGYHDMHKQQYLAGNDEDILQGGSDSTTSLSYLEVKQMISCRLPLKPIHRICVFSVSFLAVSQELRAPFQELARPRPQIQTI